MRFTSLVHIFLFITILGSVSGAEPLALQCSDLFAKPVVHENASKSKVTKKKYKPRQTQDYYLTISEGRQVYMQLMAPAKPDMPTLLMMPGGYRNWLVPEEHMQILAAQGFGIATFTVSVQPFSVATLRPGTEPAFLKNDYTIKDFALEIEAVTNQLMAQGIKNLVPVSLSLSAPMGTQFSIFDFVIDVAPVTSTAAQVPELGEGRRVLKALELMNPFFGRAYTRSALDKGYREHSAGQVDRLAEHFVLPAERREQMITGLMKLWRSVEDFTWEASLPSAKQRHVFLLGKNEKPELLKHQLQTFRRMLQTQEDALMYFVYEAGHFLPVEQPQIFARILSELLLPGQDPQAGKAQTGVVVFDPKAGEPQRIRGSEAMAFIDKLLAEMK